MQARVRVAIVIALAVAVIGGIPPSTRPQPQIRAYLDPALSTAGESYVSAIVSATSLDTATAAIRQVEGTPTAQLWLINAVAATIPTRRLSELAVLPGVQSVVANKHVTTTSASCLTACDDRDGWVSDRRERGGIYDLDGNQQTPAAFLPDGGFVSVADNGRLLFVNADGSVRARISLPSAVFRTAPAIGADGSLYLAPEDRLIYAIGPDGARRWTYTNAEKFIGGVVIATDRLYAVDEKRTLIALSAATGTPLWRTKLGGDAAGSIDLAPIVGADGSLYVVSSSNPGYAWAVAPDGRVRWSFVSAAGTPLSYRPLLASGTIYLTSAEKTIYALDMLSGVQRFMVTTAAKIMAQPAVAEDGRLFVATDDGTLIALDAEGTQQFTFRPGSGHFKTSPVLSHDRRTVFVAREEKTLFAVDSMSGRQIWQYTTLGNIKAGPALDALGNVAIGSEGNDFVVLSPGGDVTTRLAMIDKIAQSASTDRSGTLLVALNGRRLARMRYLPSTWDGKADVEPGEIKREWKLSNPLPIDLGADRLHERGITGHGVTVAVIDSGVYFNKHVEDILGASLDKQYLGQADFVGDGTCTGGGTQYPGFCLSDHSKSMDRYGHGSHVAGIIWSQIIDYATGVRMGVAPDANILSVRVLDDRGMGTYADVIEGIQFVVANRAQLNVRVMNLSLSAYATVPYFVDPLNRAAEQAWASGIAVVAAAGNEGPAAETITVPGSDPYVITVGAINSNRTAGFWADDYLPGWTATGPTIDGFAKPDILAPGANIISFLYTDKNNANVALLARQHPDYNQTTSLFRMNGTSMATAAVSGVIALMIQAHPELTPDQIKYRLLDSARPAFAQADSRPAYNVLQQGAGRIWAPDAVLPGVEPIGSGNPGMDLAADLAHGYQSEADLAYHYQGPIRKILSDGGDGWLYYIDTVDKTPIGLGVARQHGLTWIDEATLSGGGMSWAGGRMSWSGGLEWSGGLSLAAGRMSWSGGRMSWSGGRMSWSGGRMSWSGGRMSWSGGHMSWSGSSDPGSASISSTSWIGDWQN